MTSLQEMMHDTGAFRTANAQAHLSLLRVFCRVHDILGSPPPLSSWMETYTEETQEARTNQYLWIINYRYTLYLDHLVTLRDRPRDEWPLPPWDVALFWHAHLLSPVHFVNDISGPRWNSLAGLLDFPLARLLAQLMTPNTDSNPTPGSRDLLIEDPSQLENQVVFVEYGTGVFPPPISHGSNYNPFRFTRSPPATARFSLDLIQAVKRQLAFAKKITAIYPYDPIPDSMLINSQERYVKFMNLIRLNVTPHPVPAMDIDLFWHTHQLTISNYLPWCSQHVGRQVNHSDIIPVGQLSMGLDNTIAAWEITYSEDYLISDASLAAQGQPSLSPFPASIPGPTTADRTPPLGLTPAQYKLWDFDVARQVEHEQAWFEVKLLRSQLADVERRLISLDHEADIIKHTNSLGVDKARKMGLIRGFETILSIHLQGKIQIPQATQVFMSLKEQHENIRKKISSIEMDRNFQRSNAGFQRWPLLVAARIGGPAGSNNLNFPIYAATWYHNEPLEYYNYINGGRDGGPGVEGGGIRVGGALCGSQWMEGYEPPTAHGLSWN